MSACKINLNGRLLQNLDNLIARNVYISSHPKNKKLTNFDGGRGC